MSELIPMTRPICKRNQLNQARNLECSTINSKGKRDRDSEIVKELNRRLNNRIKGTIKQRIRLRRGGMGNRSSHILTKVALSIILLSTSHLQNLIKMVLNSEEIWSQLNRKSTLRKYKIIIKRKQEESQTYTLIPQELTTSHSPSGTILSQTMTT